MRSVKSWRGSIFYEGEPRSLSWPCCWAMRIHPLSQGISPLDRNGAEGFSASGCEPTTGGATFDGRESGPDTGWYAVAAQGRSRGSRLVALLKSLGLAMLHSAQ